MVQCLRRQRHNVLDAIFQNLPGYILDRQPVVVPDIYCWDLLLHSGVASSIGNKIYCAKVKYDE